MKLSDFWANDLDELQYKMFRILAFLRSWESDLSDWEKSNPDMTDEMDARSDPSNDYTELAARLLDVLEMLRELSQFAKESSELKILPSIREVGVVSVAIIFSAGRQITLDLRDKIAGVRSAHTIASTQFPLVYGKLSAESSELRHRRSAVEDAIKSITTGKPGRPVTTSGVVEFAIVKRNQKPQVPWKKIASEWNYHHPKQKMKPQAISQAVRRHLEKKKPT